MIKIESKRMELPLVYFIQDKSELKDIPIGIPFFVGDESSLPYITQILEFEVLLNAAMRTGFPFNFRKILYENGFTDMMDFPYDHPLKMAMTTEKLVYDDLSKLEDEIKEFTKEEGYKLKDYIKDSSCVVDIEKLKALNVFPTWMTKLEDAIKTNIHNFATFNSNMYNKKLEGMYGSLEMTSPNKSLIIIDISGSIPKQVSSTVLVLSKNLAENFYADIMITGTHTILYPYEELHTLNIETIYEMGMNNECAEYRRLLFTDVRHYETVIGFGDNDCPLSEWQGTKAMTREEMHAKSRWTAKKLISFHTKNGTELASYLEGFPCSNVEYIQNWVCYLGN